MDYSKITLLPEELKMLKRLAKYGPCDLSRNDQKIAMSLVLKFYLAKVEDNGKFNATKDGRRYLCFLKAAQRDLWLRSMWIPILVSVITTLIVNALEWWLSPI